MKKITTLILITLLSFSLIIILNSCDDGKTTISPAKHPVIEEIIADLDTVGVEGIVTLTCDVTDGDTDIEDLTFEWSSHIDNFIDGDDEQTVRWQAPTEVGDYNITVSVSDGGEPVTATKSINVFIGERAPEIIDTYSTLSVIDTNTVAVLTCIAVDPNGDEIIYTWSATDGSFEGENGHLGYQVEWKSPLIDGSVSITVIASDGELESEESFSIEVEYGNGNEAPDSPESPYPSSGAVDVVSNSDLKWICRDDDVEDLEFDIYMGATANSMELIVEGWSGSHDASDRYTYGNNIFNMNETFYWKVDVRDNYGHFTEGQHWFFTTQERVDRDTTFTMGTLGREIEMIWVYPGRFMMGATDVEEGYDDEKPRHEVTISYGFWMSKHEVTQYQWGAVPDQNWGTFGFPGFDQQPVERIPWYNVINGFIPALNETEVNSPWRLPSEAEWEYVSRSGTEEDPYPWGYNEAIYGDYAWFGQLTGGPIDVGQKVANPWGFYDMHGNVWELTMDREQEQDNYNGAPVDGSAWDGTAGARVVRRGGSWNSGSNSGRCASRDFLTYTHPSYTTGFRLVRMADEE